MKLKKFNEFLNENLKTDKMVVKNVESNDYNYITKIELEDGRTIIPGEDTGGEFASLEIENGQLENGDIIDFEYDHDDNSELWGVDFITINGKKYKCIVGSEGGNTATYLVIK